MRLLLVHAKQALPVWSHKHNHMKCTYQVRLLYQVYLSITDDGKGIQALDKALTLASSTKVEPTDHEIGQFGKGLKYAPWHIGDDCFIETM